MSSFAIRLRARSGGALALIALVAAGSAPGCYGATEIAVLVTTTADCGRMDTQLYTGATGTKDFGTAPAAETMQCDVRSAAGAGAVSTVGTLSIVPSGTREDHFDLEVIGGVGVAPADCHAIAAAGRSASGASGGPPMASAPTKTTGCIVARRRISFRPHQSLRIPIVLSASCIDVPCGFDETCDLGVCTPTDLCDPASGCPRERVDTSVPEADASTDAPIAVDAAGDAPVVDAAPSRCGLTAQIVVDKQDIVGQLVVQGTDFLYIDNDAATGGTEVRRVPRDGSGPPVAVASSAAIMPATLQAVAAAGNDVAWTEQGANTALHVSMGGAGAASDLILGGDHDQTSIAFSKSLVVGFTHLSGDVTWKAFTYAPSTHVITGAFRTLPARVPEILVDDVGDFYGVAAGTYATLFHYSISGTDGPLEVGLVTAINPLVPDIALTGHDLYVAGSSSAGPGIFRIDRGSINNTYNGKAWFPMMPAETPQSLASDADYLYYANANKLARLPLNTGATPKAASFSLRAAGVMVSRLQVDDQCVYWVEDGTRIMKQKK